MGLEATYIGYLFLFQFLYMDVLTHRLFIFIECFVISVSVNGLAFN